MLAVAHAAITTDTVHGSAVIAAVIGAGIAGIASYKAAVQVAESYASALRLVVDLGRKPLADALAITLPNDLATERELWTALTGTSLYGPRTARSNGWLAVIDAHRTEEQNSLG